MSRVQVIKAPSAVSGNRVVRVRCLNSETGVPSVTDIPVARVARVSTVFGVHSEDAAGLRALHWAMGSTLATVTAKQCLVCCHTLACALAVTALVYCPPVSPFSFKEIPVPDSRFVPPPLPPLLPLLPPTVSRRWLCWPAGRQMRPHCPSPQLVESVV